MSAIQTGTEHFVEGQLQAWDRAHGWHDTVPHAISQEADIGLNEPQQRDGRNLFCILIDTLEVLETVKDRQQYLEDVLHVLNSTVPGSDARAYGVSKVSLETIVT